MKQRTPTGDRRPLPWPLVRGTQTFLGVNPRWGLVGGAFLAAVGVLDPSAALAKNESSTSGSSEAATLRSEYVLPATESFLSVGVGLQSEKLLAFSCAEPCKQGRPQVVETLPSEVLTLKKTARVLELRGGGRLLWIRFGTDALHYSVVIRGGLRPSTEAVAEEPQIVLRGWAGEESSSGSRLFFEGGRLSLIGAPKKAVCGREIASSTRIYDPKKGSFKGVLPPVLSGEERAQAKPLVAVNSKEGAGELLLKLSAKTSGSASEVVDGDIEHDWDGGHEFAELNPPPGQPLKDLGVVVSSPLKEPAYFWLATESAIYRVELPVGPSTFFSLELPLEDVPGCVAAIQPKNPAPIAEIVLRVPVKRVPTTEELVMQLNQSEHGLSGAALALRGEEAAAAVARVYPRMSTMARARAIDLAFEMPGPFRARILVAALEFGSQVERERSLEALSGLLEAAVGAIVRRLPKAEQAGRLHLSASLAELSPKAAVRPLSRQLGRGSSAERLALRRLVADLSDQEGTESSFQKLLAEQNGAHALPRRAQVELTRALLLKLPSLGPDVRKMLRGLAQDASFQEAYLLAPAVLQLSPQLREFENTASSWLVGTLPAKATAVERAALSVRILELLRDAEDSEVDWNEEVRGLLSSGNPRVRRVAFQVLKEHPGQVSEQELTLALRDDKWPQVRAASAEAASALSPTSETGKELARVLSKRLPRDDHPVVRRAIARSLGHIADERGIKALRKALKRDESYEVRAEAALSLGDLCDPESIEPLSSYAQQLGSGAMGDGPILLGLASLSALIRLNPPDLNSRVEPLLSKNVPGVLRNQVEVRLEHPPAQVCSLPQN